MTSEKRIIVGIEDIKSITLECKKCKVRLTFSPDAIGLIPFDCPNRSCKAEWRSQIPAERSEPARPMLLRFISAIADIRRRNKENEVEQTDQSIGFRILLEFDATN